MAYEFLTFGLKQARSAIFAGSFYVYDIRLFLIVAVFALFWRTRVYFTVTT